MKVRQVMLYASQQTVRKRRKVVHGSVKLTQTLHYLTSTQTKIASKDYAHFPGLSNMTDVIGPLELDPPESLQMIPKDDRAKWWGRHLIPAGGHDDDAADDDDRVDDEDLDDGDQPEQQPGPQKSGLIATSMHALPDVLPLDVFAAFNVKHVLDFSPCSPALAVQLVEAGISYWGLCASAYMKEKLDAWIHAGLLQALQDPQNGLFDRRLGPNAMDTDTSPSPALPPPPQTPTVPNVAPPLPPPLPSKLGKATAKTKAAKASTHPSVSPAPSSKAKPAATGSSSAPGRDLAALLAQARASMNCEGELMVDPDAEHVDGLSL